MLREQEMIERGEGISRIRENIWIGGREYIDEVEFLRGEGITAILNVACEINNSWDIRPDYMRMVKIGLRDNDSNMPYMKDLAVYALKMMLENGEKVLVHCAAGRSRSVWVVCKALADLEKRQIDDILLEVQQKRPQAFHGPLFPL